MTEKMSLLKFKIPCPLFGYCLCRHADDASLQFIFMDCIFLLYQLFYKSNAYKSNNNIKNQPLWCTPVILVLVRLRSEAQEFKTSLLYSVYEVTLGYKRLHLKIKWSKEIKERKILDFSVPSHFAPTP